MLGLRLFGAGLLASTTVSACDPGHSHSKFMSKRIQPGSTEALPYPTRELEWSDINFISTTDSHGWLVGHQKSSYPEPNYSGDFGDFYSFVHWMKKKAVEKDVDLLLIDSGDLHDGNGLSDAGVQEFSGEVDAVRSNTIFAQLPYDVLAIGNHELYVANVTQDVHENFAPKWKGRYLSSNANITVTDKSGKKKSVPVGGNRFSKFKTRKGKKVTAFGILYNFQGGSSIVNVTNPAAMVNETWFLDAIKEQPDLFILAGHMPIRGTDSAFDLAIAKIRALHPTTPVFVFGGHTHIRDCAIPDKYSIAIESGRYMETVGFVSSNLPGKHSTEALKTSRRYIDPSRNSYAWHTKRDTVFDTDKGINITMQMQNIVSILNTSQTIGVAPQDYYLQRTAYGSNDSMLTLLTNEVMPKVIVDETRPSGQQRIVIVNSGSQRFDLFQGPFTQNDNYIVSPFLDAFNYIELPFRVASQILASLNKVGAYKRNLHAKEEPFERSQRMAYEHFLSHGTVHSDAEKRSLELQARGQVNSLTLGYVTKDGCEDLGDDILHAPIPFSSDIPDYISTPIPTGVADDTLIDLVFLDFFASSIIPIANALDPTLNLTMTSVHRYGPEGADSAILRTDKMWGDYAAKYWNSN